MKAKKIQKHYRLLLKKKDKEITRLYLDNWHYKERLRYLEYIHEHGVFNLSRMRFIGKFNILFEGFEEKYVPRILVTVLILGLGAILLKFI